MMEESNLAISELTTISESGESGRIGLEPIDSKLSPEEATMNGGEPSAASPTTSGNTLMIHVDDEGRHPDEEEPHPCMLDVDVLEYIFKHIINQSSSSRNIVKDVRNIRLVCKTWRNVITPLYRRTHAPIVFELVRYSLPRIRTFLEVMKKSDMIPIQSYKFMKDYFKQDTDQELFKDVLLTCGSGIVSLYMDFGHYAKKFDLTRLAKLNLKKLKKLEFRFESYDNYLQTHGLVSCLGVFLNSAKELEELKFNFQRGSILNSPSNAPVKEQLERVICRGLPKTVKTLHLPTTLLGETSFNTLIANGLKLEEFQLDVSGSSGFYENEPALREFLEKQTNTLKTLRVLDGGLGSIDDESLKFVFPRLNDLLCLDLIEVVVNPFSFTQKFPKLQRLDVDGWDKKGQLPKSISDHFPNITELHLSPDSEWVDVKSTLHGAFVHFPNIERLYISMTLPNHLTFDADSLFSGVCEADCKRIRRESNFARVNLVREQSMPSILNLTKLKKLVVDHHPERGRFRLTNYAAHFVFLKMANLKELSLSMAKMSPEYIELLKKKLTLRWRQRDMRSARTKPTFLEACKYKPIWDFDFD